MTGHLCTVQVDLSALIHNYGLLTKDNRKVLPVIKNNAYGHGLVNVAKALQEAGCECMAVGPLNEAVALREAGVKGIIIPLLGCVGQKDYEIAIKHDLHIVLHNMESLNLAMQNKAPNVIVKMNTGMGRLGFLKEEVEEVIEVLQKNNTTPFMVMSHLSSADVPAEMEYTLMQAETFKEAASKFKQVFPSTLSSLGNSAGTVAYPELAGELPRAGIILYGGNPFYKTEKEHVGKEYKDGMTVSAPLLSVHKLNAGESLSYGRSYKATKDMMVAWVGIGYADGYKRNPTPNDENGQGGIQVLLHGKRCPVIGRVNMQMTAIDITELVKDTTVNVGDLAILLGGETDNRISADELAAWWGTIPHEVMTTFGKLM